MTFKANWYRWLTALWVWRKDPQMKRTYDEIKKLPRRELTVEETKVLRVIQDVCGKKYNTEEQVFFVPPHDAFLFAKTDDGTMPIAVNLSVYARKIVEGISANEIKKDIFEPVLKKLEQNNS